MFDILIQKGTYPDFERNCLVNGDIGIRSGKIAAVGQLSGPGVQAARVIDGTGKIVSPGFIDIHMHEENFLEEGDRYVVAEMMARMGVTSCLGGNCGVQNQDLKVFKEKIRQLGGAPVNYMMMAGYNEYRVKMGIGHYDKASAEQREQLVQIMKRELAEGAFGISFGIEYDPGMDTEEILQCLEAFEDNNLLIAAHYRADAAKAKAAIDEMIEIAERSGKKFQISHLSSCSAMGQMTEALGIINEAMEKNPKLSYDTYPYNAFSTHIGSTVFDEGGMEGWNKGYDSLLLTDEPYKDRYCDEELFRKVRAEYPEMLVVAFVMNEEEIAQAISNPRGMVASDAIINHGNGHPRAAGTFPRLLRKYVREDKVLTMVDALRKITLEPAKRLNLENHKAQILPGFDADLVVFDPEEIQDGATFSNLHIPPAGIDFVLLNGEITVDHAEIVNRQAGRFISYKEIAD